MLAAAGAGGDPATKTPEPGPETGTEILIDIETRDSPAPGPDTSYEAPAPNSAAAILDAGPQGAQPEPGQALEMADVVLVDDDTVLAELLIYALENRGYSCLSL